MSSKQIYSKKFMENYDITQKKKKKNSLQCKVRVMKLIENIKICQKINYTFFYKKIYKLIFLGHPLNFLYIYI